MFKVCASSFWYRDEGSKDVVYLSPIFAVVSVLKSHSKELKGSEVLNLKAASYTQENLGLAETFLADDREAKDSLREWFSILKQTSEIEKNIDPAVPILRKAFGVLSETERQAILLSMKKIISKADETMEHALVFGEKNEFPFAYKEMQKVFLERESEAHMRYMDLRDHFLTPEGQMQLAKFDKDEDLVAGKQSIETERLAVWSELRKASVVSSSRKSVAEALAILGVLVC